MHRNHPGGVDVLLHSIFLIWGESRSEIIGFGLLLCCSVTLESNTGKHRHITHQFYSLKYLHLH